MFSVLSNCNNNGIYKCMLNMQQNNPLATNISRVMSLVILWRTISGKNRPVSFLGKWHWL